MTQPRIISPTDWQAVGRELQVIFEWPGEDAPPPVRVFDRAAYSEWMHAGQTGALPTPVLTLAAVRDPSGKCRAGAGVKFPIGELILTLGGTEAGEFAEASGVQVCGPTDRWARLIPELIRMRSSDASALGALPEKGPQPFFSITCTVFDTPPEFLDQLFDCLQDQTFTDYEWMLLDNGSSQPEVVARLASMSERDSRIRLFRVDDNIHIIPGNRYLLERARGRYIVPIDSDDLVYRDALDLLARTLASDGAPGEAPDEVPDVAFSEECKTASDGTPVEYIWRPSFSRLFSLSTCPAAHVMAFRRELALEVDSYSDAYAQGSHDWDTCLRMMVAGAKVVRVPHVLYGWRMHAGSSAMSAKAKDYLKSSQEGVLGHALQRMGLAEKFTVEPSELGGLGFYHLQRRRISPRPIAVDLLLREDSAAALQNLSASALKLEYPELIVRVLVPEPLVTESLREDVARRLKDAGVEDVEILVVPATELGRVVSSVPDGCCAKAVVDSSIRLANADWLWDSLGTLELDSETGIIGGCILDRQGNVQSVGYYAGLEGLAATPNHGQPQGVVYGQLAYIRRSVTAVYGGLMVVRPEVFEKAGPLHDVDSDDGVYGIEFCLRAARHGFRSAYSPRLKAVHDSGLPRRPGIGHPLRGHLRITYPELAATDPYYSALLGNSSATFGTRVWNESLPENATSPLLYKLVRGAASVAYRTRDTAKQVVRRAMQMVSKRPVHVTRSLPPAPPGGAQAQPAGSPVSVGYLPPTGLVSPADPLNLVVDPELSEPHLNVLLPGIAMGSMSGGPNTIYNLCYRLAALGVPVRFVSTGVPLASDLEPIWQHLQSLSGVAKRLPNVSIVDASDRGRSVAIGENDVFLATAWWTAQMVKYALPLVRSERFIYVIQDYEAVLTEHSTAHALTMETYGLDYLPLLNHQFLADYMRQYRVGRFADAEFADRAMVMHPAIDRTKFYSELGEREGPRRLLFYARPQTGKRNLFELGIAALQYAISVGGFGEGEWEFLAMGDAIAPVGLGGGHVLKPAPWCNFDDYAAQMRSADVLLSLMLSPHPSYPPLEMAACGGLVVTNCYANKTQEQFDLISANIKAPDATIEGIGKALAEASHQAADLEARRRGVSLPEPPSWEDALEPVLPWLRQAFHDCLHGVAVK